MKITLCTTTLLCNSTQLLLCDTDCDPKWCLSMRCLGSSYNLCLSFCPTHQGGVSINPTVPASTAFFLLSTFTVLFVHLRNLSNNQHFFSLFFGSGMGKETGVGGEGKLHKNRPKKKISPLLFTLPLLFPLTHHPKKNSRKKPPIPPTQWTPKKRKRSMN